MIPDRGCRRILFAVGLLITTMSAPDATGQGQAKSSGAWIPDYGEARSIALEREAPVYMALSGPSDSSLDIAAIASLRPLSEKFVLHRPGELSLDTRRIIGAMYTPACAIVDGHGRLFELRSVWRPTTAQMREFLTRGLEWFARMQGVAPEKERCSEILLRLESPREKDRLAAMEAWRSIYDGETIANSPAHASLGRASICDYMAANPQRADPAFLGKVLGGDPNAFVRAAAARALALSATQAEEPGLIRIAGDRQQFFGLREAAFEGLGGVMDRHGASEEGLSCLRRVLAENTASAIIAMHMLGGLRDQESLPPLLKIATSTGGWKGAAAFEVLGMMASPEAMAAIEKLVSKDRDRADGDRDAAVRLAKALGAKARCGNWSAVGSLIALASNKDATQEARYQLTLVTGFTGKFNYRSWWAAAEKQTRADVLMQSLLGDDAMEMTTREAISIILTRHWFRTPKSEARALDDLIRSLVPGQKMVDPLRWLRCNRPFLYWSAEKGTRGPWLRLDEAARASGTRGQERNWAFPGVL